MAPIVSDIDIARPPAEVYAYVTDPARFGEWQAGVVGGHIEGDGPPKVGDKCVMTRRIGGAERTSTSELTDVSPPRTWAVHGLDGPIRADVGVTVQPGPDAAQSHVTIRVSFWGVGFGKVLAPLVVWQGRREVPQSCRNLKRRLEGATDL